MQAPRAMPIAMLLAALAAAAPAQAQQDPLPPPQYTVKEDSPRAGSNIRREIGRGSEIPINRRYDQLTADERRIVRGWWENIAETDEPPFPADGMKGLHEAMAHVEQRVHARGPMVLVANVAPDGQVTDVKALASPDPEITRYAATIVMLTKFKPAQCSGQPCRMDFPLRYTFSMN